ncbi:hypothetical protein MTR_4g053887 [Medicago truncatula]|uniref:Uncharacterized protein n=1 Tax=Medicago truncatula TaxID=3880 RepID=A0A072UKH8_MEDTR|nr:hypothetical protein MTR_4g053887 [Medicago truncatula]
MVNIREGPLANNPVTDFDKAVNKLRQKYRSYIVEYDAEEGAVMLPNMFAKDFGDQIRRFATLIDPKNNKFEVLLERVNGHDRFGKNVKCPIFNLPMQFVIDKTSVQPTFNNVVPPSLIGGEWKLFVDCCNLYEEMRMRFGAPAGGKNNALYVKVVAN